MSSSGMGSQIESHAEVRAAVSGRLIRVGCAAEGISGF